MAKWYVIRGEQERGPFDDAQIKEFAADGKLKPEHRVRRDDWTTARTAKDIKGLFPTIAPSPVTNKPVLPPTEPPSQPELPLFERPAILVLLTIFFFPAGLYFVWMKPQWSKKQKWKWTGCVAAAFLLVMVFAEIQVRQAREDLADAQRLWSSGDRAAAISKYRALLRTPSAIREEDRSLLYGRVIDFDAENGNLSLAEKLLADADSRSIVPSITNFKARELAANLHAQRQQAEEREKAATVAQSRKKSKYSRAEFKDLVIGMTKDEVLSSVGKPIDTQELGDLEFWYYQNITYDPITDKTDSRVQIGFQAGRASSVNAI